MHRSLKKWTILSITMILTIGLVGCSWGEKVNNMEPTATPSIEKNELEEKMKAMDEQAKKDVENAGEVSKDEINKAVTYIDTHANDSFKTKEVSEKLAYYGAYLKHAGAKTTEGTKHELARMGENVHTYIRNVYTKTEEETSKISTNLKSGIHTSLANINKAKDHTIDEFHKMVK